MESCFWDENLCYVIITPNFTGRPLLVRAANKSKYVRRTSAEFKWGVRHIQEVIRWSDRFELIDEFPIMSEVGGTKGLMSMLFHRITGSHLYAIAQLELGPVPAS
jgi:hypothetical protein